MRVDFVGPPWKSTYEMSLMERSDVLRAIRSISRNRHEWDREDEAMNGIVQSMIEMVRRRFLFSFQYSISFQEHQKPAAHELFFFSLQRANTPVYVNREIQKQETHTYMENNNINNKQANKRRQQKRRIAPPQQTTWTMMTKRHQR